MPDCLPDAQPIALPVLVPFSPIGQEPPVRDRRRPGRIEDTTPELIKLMRKPGRAARIRVALYDAPGFLLQADRRGPRLDGPGAVHMAVALAACSALTGIAIKGMMIAWG